MKTGYLLFLAAFLFLSIVPTVAKVVNSVADCNQFLLQNKPPELPGILKDGNIQGQYKPICQTFKDKPRFLTVYDITNKIPVFSAYKYIGIENEGRPPNYWKIEPQLEGKTEDNMEDEVKGQTYTKQASSPDYESDIYDKGHLYPSLHGSTDDDKESTMTLTNIVPQAKDFNQKRWSKMEDCIKCLMAIYCRAQNDKNKIEGFVVTGAQAGTKKLNEKVNTPVKGKVDTPPKAEVNIPSTVWSAFCCYHPWTKKWIASAHWDKNEGSDDEYMKSQTLSALHDKLGEGANLFPGTQCILDKTLGDYPIGDKKHIITAKCGMCK